MAGVSINTGSADYRDELSKVSEDQWNAIFSQRRLYIHTEFEHGCECVINWLAEAEEFYERLGFESADQMLLEKLEIPPDWVRMAAAVLEASGENLSKAEVDKAIELKSHGGDRRSEQAQQNQGSNATLKQERGADYIKARLRRDHPEIAEQLERGEHRSARAAGIAAGFIKDVPSVPMNEPAKAAAAILRRTGKEFAAQLAIELANLTADA